MEGNLNSEGIKSQEVNFSKEKSLEDILSTELNVENINTYAEDALKNLIEFADKKVIDYQKINPIEGLSDKEIEDKAFEHYGIENINLILDHINNKAKEISGLNQIIDKIGQVNKIDQVIIEPDKISHYNITSGNGEYKERRTVDRLKTILFILKEDFKVDINDPNQLTIQEGVLREDMMRKNSYYFLQVPSIDRIILVCDEIGNITYVFNSKELTLKEIENQQIISSTKSELNQLIENNPNLGRSVIYNKNGFVPRIIDAIEKPISTIPDELSPNMKDTAKYLIPKPPEGYLSNLEIAKKLGMSPDPIKKIIGGIDPDQFGKVNKYLIRTHISNGYSPEQINMIIKQAEKIGYSNKPPEGYLSSSSIGANLGIDYQTIEKIISKIDPKKFGEIKEYFFHVRNANGYSPKQIDMIKDQTKKIGYSNKAPENYLPIRSIAKELGVGSLKIREAIGEINSEQFGEVKEYFFKTQPANCYSTEQQKMIREYIDSHKK